MPAPRQPYCPLGFENEFSPPFEFKTRNNRFPSDRELRALGERNSHYCTLDSLPPSTYGCTSILVYSIAADNTGWLYAWSCDTGHITTAFNTHLPILQMHMSADASRVSLMLERCPHLPLLCVHNSPAGPLLITHSSKKRSRTHSITSTGSKKAQQLHGIQNKSLWS